MEGPSCSSASPTVSEAKSHSNFQGKRQHSSRQKCSENAEKSSDFPGVDKSRKRHLRRKTSIGNSGMSDQIGSPFLRGALFLLLIGCARTVLCDIDQSIDRSQLPIIDNSAEKLLLSSSEIGSGQGDSTGSINANLACNEVRYYYNALSEAKGFTALDTSSIPQKAVSGDHLKICARGFTCCTTDMESQLSEESEKDYQRVVQDKIIGLRHTFEAKTSKFDRFFRELLINSRTDLHSMFLQTYGQIYSQHSEIFITLFDNLTEYYTRGKLDLHDSLDGFYKSLYRRMFKIMNPHYQFSESYWRCMEPMMERLKPFGEVPQKMKQQVIRSFVAARTFVQALAVARDSIRKVMEMEPGSQCASALMRMMYCPHCRGLPGLKPCNNFCLNVMKGCLAHQADLDPDWNSYVDMLLQLLARIEGPFNVESVIDGIDVKISEAIMIFQENGPTVSKQVFEGCGSPDEHHAGRNRRNTRHEEFRLDDLRYGAQADNKPRPTTAAGTNLERLSREIKKQVTPVKGFWKNLPYTLCNDNQVAAPAKRDTDCWNGVTRDRYQASLVGDGVLNQGKNPEVALETDRPNTQIGEVIMALRRATNLMRRAYNGHDVSWDNTGTASSDKEGHLVDDSELEEFSGSGDGEHSDLESPKSRTGIRPVSPIDTDDEDFATTRSPIRKSSKIPVVNSGENPDDEDAVGSGSGDGDSETVFDWRETHRDPNWETDRNRRPPVMRPPESNPAGNERPKFVQPPVRFDADPPAQRPTDSDFETDFEIGIKSGDQKPPTKGASSSSRGSIVAWCTLLGFVLSFVVRL